MSENDDLGLSIISGNGGRLIVNLTEATRLENSRLSSADRFGPRLSLHNPFTRSSLIKRVHDCSRFDFRREVASFDNQNGVEQMSWLHLLVTVPNITPPPMTRHVSWWGFTDVLSDSEVVPGLRCAVLWRTTAEGDPAVSLDGLVLALVMLDKSVWL